jgi:hypothetical protein
MSSAASRCKGEIRIINPIIWNHVFKGKSQAGPTVGKNANSKNNPRYVIMLTLRFFSLIIPAQKAAAIPANRLGGLIELTEKPTTPPRDVDKVPTYGPSRIPIIGAIIAAAVIPCWDNPIIGEILMKPKTAYSAVKTAVRATCFEFSLVRLAI